MYKGVKMIPGEWVGGGGMTDLRVCGWTTIISYDDLRFVLGNGG